MTVALLFLSSGLAHADQLYIVRKHETLTGIARDHGLSLSELAEYNGLSRDTKVHVGQRLQIPDKSGAAPASALSGHIRRAIVQANVEPGRWRYIVVHHSGMPVGTLKGMDRYHREERHMENGLAYHFLIGNGNGMGDGEIAASHRWTEQLDGGHLASESLNKISLGICLVGNFDRDEPTAKQLRSLNGLIDALRTRCNLPVSAVKTHQQINPIYTRCPGRLFPSRSFLRDLRAKR